MSEDNTPSDDLDKPRLGPGDRLQSARISIGMTLEQVAGKMHLSTAILTSLEENNFDDITAPIFVKGYLRAYSRLVNENEEEIIQQYTRYYMDGDPPISSTSNTLPEINADDPRVRWMTRIIILVLVGLLALWWWNRYQHPSEMVSLDTTDQRDTMPDEKNRLTGSEAVASDADIMLQQQNAGIEENLDASLEPATLEPATLEPAMEVEQLETAANDAVLLPDNQITVSEDRKLDAAAAAPESEQVIQQRVLASIADAPPEATTAASQGLVIVVNADTWASIKDASGKTLLKDLLRAGETFTLQGEAPINVFLGNGYGASMTYNGETVDFVERIKSNNTVRFVVGN